MNARGAFFGCRLVPTTLSLTLAAGLTADLKNRVVSGHLNPPPPEAPQLLPEPALTAGTSNLLQWTPAPGAAEYLAQCAKDDAFAVGLLDSGWISGDHYLFTGLLPGTTYWYRVKARTLAGEQTWQQTTRADFAADTLDNVSIDAVPDDVVLIDGSLPRVELLGGEIQNGSVDHALRVNVFRCDVDRLLTGIEHHLGVPWSRPLQFLVYESTTFPGVFTRIHINQVDSGPKSGWHGSGPIAVPLSAGKYYAIGAAWDIQSTYYYCRPTAEPVSWGIRLGNQLGATPPPQQLECKTTEFSYHQRLTTVGSPGYVPAGHIVSTPIDLPAGGAWGDVRFGSTVPADTSLAVDVVDHPSGALLRADVASGASLADLESTAIRLRANLASSDPARTPALHDWAVTMLDPVGGAESAWSDVQFSTQCTPSPRDLDGDCDVDADDLRIFEACSSGPAVPYDPQSLPAECPLVPDALNRIAADADRDGDVDAMDFAVLQRCHAGPDRLVDPTCAD